jgi:ABC-type phosphate/phosphonate transport system substrate-binding protein
MRTPEFSDHLIVASSKLPEKTVQALRQALFGLKNDNEGRAILNRVKEGTTGIVPGQDNAYDSMRDVLRQLEKLGTK